MNTHERERDGELEREKREELGWNVHY